MSVGLRDVLREPLVHFLLIGAALFALDFAVNGDERPAAAPAETSRTQRVPIVVDAQVREALTRTWTLTHSEPPSPAELEVLLERWIDEEVLYREGLRRGLADSDPQIRQRVADQMKYALEQGATALEPTDAQQRAWFDAHRAELVQPPRVDFTQVFVEGDGDADKARAKALLVLLEDGAEPAGLGDTFAGGRRFRGRKVEDVGKRFGTRFSEGLGTEPLGAWTLRRSSFGFHLVRIDRRVAGAAPTFEAAKAEVVHRLKEEHRAARLAEQTQALREQWSVVREP